MSLPTTPHAEPERELVAPVDLCRPDGRLNPEAVGWSRRPLVRANLSGWGRNKRFEYWCITSPELVVALNISHSDYRVTLASFFLDRTSLKDIALAEVRWLPRGLVTPMSEVSGGGALHGKGDGIEVRMTPEDGGTRLWLRSDRIEIDAFAAEPPGHESMSVVVPWDDKRFQLTRKSNCMRASGTVCADGADYTLSPDSAWASLDHGRGRWPYSILWNWASASGITDGHEIGLQFGAKWTDGTPSTENALCIDGRVHKISEEMAWTYDTADFMKPWTIRGAGVDLVFTPVFDRKSNFDRVVVLSREDQCFGHFNGTITAPAGDTIRIENLFGWAEEVHRRW